ncbi:carbohydrate ABC transporter membrane protein 2 (CUT1 family) [Hydrogenispora ethanolica]|uniref:Carbohydrate ABC transporter membrane protein 2 (CUT1 family) n=1 Tax=Hydrogenispora ethanolica TaxID=1082276 RepID=A0A4R1R8V7_HYDET|nr:carbohydrate ABC transporter membrane protein 2 (CUT1 family) [Hydrogenispora ethanolica]
MRSMRASQTWPKILLLGFFVFLAVLVLIPFAAILIASFKPGKDLIRYGLNLNLDFQIMSLANYVFLFAGDHPYFVWFKNSVILTAFQSALTLLVSAAVGYGFAIYDFRFKRTLFICVLLIMMVPFEILMLPLYQQIIAIRLVDTFSGIILPYMANASTIFFFKQYLGGIPRSLIDAGRVDGASEYGIFARLIFPLMKPAFAAMGILSAMGSWNNFLWPLLVLRSSEKFTLPIGLNTLLTPYGNNYDLLIVGSCFSIIPIFILFLYFQKYFIAGMTAGSVKE